MKPQYPFEPFKIDTGFGVDVGYGPHEGWDMNGLGGGNTDLGTPLRAAADGEIVHASESAKDYGRMPVLALETQRGPRWLRYCHCDQIRVRSGLVKRGEIIATLGSSGNSTAAHLHFDIFKKKPPHWRYFAKTKATHAEYFEDPTIFFNSVILDNNMSQPWLRQMFLEQGLDLDKPEGEIRGRVQEVIDGFKKYGELQEQVTKLQKEVAFQTGEAAKHEQESIQYSQALKDLQEEVADLRRSVAQRDTDISNLQKNILSLQEKLDPEKVVPVPAEEYKKLISKNGLNAYTVRDLIGAIIKKLTHKGGA